MPAVATSVLWHSMQFWSKNGLTNFSNSSWLGFVTDGAACATHEWLVHASPAPPSRMRAQIVRARISKSAYHQPDMSEIYGPAASAVACPITALNPERARC